MSFLAKTLDSKFRRWYFILKLDGKLSDSKTKSTERSNRHEKTVKQQRIQKLCKSHDCKLHGCDLRGGEKLRRWLFDARTQHGLTQAQLAEKLGISEAYYSYIEKGERQKKMDITMVWKLSAALDKPIAEIIELEQT